MSRTPAKELARLKVHYPEWIIRTVEPGQAQGYTAQQRGAGRGEKPLSIHTLTVTELGTRLAELEEGRGPS